MNITAPSEQPKTVGEAYRRIARRAQELTAAGENCAASTGWDAWWRVLKALAGEIHYPYAYDGNEDCWRDYHRDAYSPAEALEEDISYLD